MRQKILMLFFFAFIIAFLTSCQKNTIVFESQDASVIQSNLANMGFITQSENNLYFMSLNESPSLFCHEYATNKNAQMSLINGIYLNYIKGKIFFVDADDFYVYEMDEIDGCIQRISEIDLCVNYLMAYENLLYFISIEDGANYLYSLTLDGRTVEKLSDNTVLQVYLYSDKIYYSHYNRKANKFQIYQLNVNNTSKLVFETTDQISRFWIYENNLFYKSLTTKIMKYNMVENTLKNIVNSSSITGLSVQKNDIFYTDSAGLHWYCVEKNRDLLINNTKFKLTFIACNKIFGYSDSFIAIMDLDGKNKAKFFDYSDIDL